MILHRLLWYNQDCQPNNMILMLIHMIFRAKKFTVNVLVRKFNETCMKKCKEEGELIQSKKYSFIFHVYLFIISLHKKNKVGCKKGITGLGICTYLLYRNTFIIIITRTLQSLSLFRFSCLCNRSVYFDHPFHHHHQNI